MASRILIVEDERKIARVLQLELEHEGYVTDADANGTTGFEKIMQGTWDLILLDIMLPGLDGMDILQKMHDNHLQTPVIALTAKDAVPDKVTGLDLGANDYITKPFHTEELLARIRACLRNTQETDIEDDSQNLQVGELIVNPSTRKVFRANISIALTPREFDLLVYLLENARQVLSREQIIERVWGYDFDGEANVVDVYIRYLRRKIDRDFATPYIHTVHGVGYCLKEHE